MYILTKNSVIFGAMEEPHYILRQSNGVDIVGNSANATHIFCEGEKYSRRDYDLFYVETIPEDLTFDGTWILDEEGISQSSILKKEKESALFLASLSDLALMELSARLDDLEENIRDF